MSDGRCMHPDRDVLVGHVRRNSWTRVAHGLYRREATGDERLADPLAWQQILPRTGTLTHLTVAAVHGLWLPPLPAALPVFVSMHRDETRPKRPELRVMRHTKPIASTWLQGLCLATVAETLLACARDLSLLDLVVLGDSALHQALVTRADLIAAGSRRRWGAAALLHALEWMDGRAESAWESLLRVFHRSCGVDVVPQHEVFDAAGRFVARGDLWIRGSRMLHEYDGAYHRDGATHARDLDRDRRLLAADWRRRGYVRADLLCSPERILRDADQTLGRAYRPDRLDAWLGMVAESLFSVEGRRRLEDRLGLPQSGR